MTLEDYKQFQDIICDELNIKAVIITFRKFKVKYNRETREFRLNE